jgi:eukaryotic-like serine/threonine-protein kinase
MGEVYQATDTNLKRAVAIKVLPGAVAADADRLARFQREAEVLASLNHPNIAQVHGLEKSDGTTALVMELVEGPTLADRITLGPMPLDEALPIAKQIAGALEAAHEQGIIHRDLKPANIKVRPDGTVKVLDFGLAKAMEPVTAGLEEASELRTITTPALTQAGVIFGTAAYMSPEQARGKPVDKRTDIWAFGCLLYETLTGRVAFSAETTLDTIAVVLGRAPDWSRLPGSTPLNIRRLLERCLEKDPKRRLRDIGDARMELDDALTEERASRPRSFGDAPNVERPWRTLALAGWMIVLALVTVTAVVTVWWAFRPEAPAAELRVELTTPPTTDPVSLAIAPDGRRVVFVAASDGRPQLWLRSLDTPTAQPLAGTDAATFPFWSPDSRSIGFFADGKLRRMDSDGGSATILANAPLGQGGAWNRDGTILFAPAPASPLLQISATGGEPTAVTTIDPQQVGHSFPQFLPDGRHFLYYVEGVTDARGVYVGELRGNETKRLLDADAAAVYAPPGHLLFVRQLTLLAQAFDPVKLAVTGRPFPVGEHVAVQRAALGLSVSRDGHIVYRTGSASGEGEYVWFDRFGKELGRLGSPPGSARAVPSFAPNGRTVALHTVSGNADIWVVDVERGAYNRLTVDAADDILPIWSPDGTRIAFSSTRKGGLDLYLKSASGAGNEDLLLETPQTKALSDWSSDGRFLLYSNSDPKTGFDIWVLPLEGDRTPYPFVQTKFNERLAQFSPDGKWIAYESNESGRYEIYVQPFSRSNGKAGGTVPVSTGGGAQVRWRPDGKALFYIALDDRFMMVPITSSSEQALDVGAAVALFTARVVGGAQQPFARYQYSVAPDGQRFLVNTITAEASAPITLILNWKPKS